MQYKNKINNDLLREKVKNIKLKLEFAKLKKMERILLCALAADRLKGVK